MNKTSRIISIFLLILYIQFMQFIPASAAANKTPAFVALGDSIVTGYGLEDFKQNNAANIKSDKNFVNKISKRLNEKSVNLGVEGTDSTYLLKLIQNPASPEQVKGIAGIKEAGHVVISTGGNNVFIPILNAVNEKLKNGMSIFTATPQEIQIAALRLIIDKTAMKELENTVLSNVSKFTGDGGKNKPGDLENIIKQVKKINPAAEIVVLTVYNPYSAILPEVFNNAVKSMNAKIVNGSGNGKNYKVADVYSAFEKANPKLTLVNSAAGKWFDPHPTARGHEVIYSLVAYEIQNCIPYDIKSVISKGKLETRIEEGELIMTVKPSKGYKAPTYITLTIGKGEKQIIRLNNGIASIPAAEVNDSIQITGVCGK